MCVCVCVPTKQEVEVISIVYMIADLAMARINIEHVKAGNLEFVNISTSDCSQYYISIQLSPIVPTALE